MARLFVPILATLLTAACYYGDPGKDPDPYCTDESLVQPKSIGIEIGAAGSESSETSDPETDQASQ
jgi:hypothetical protein